MLKRNFKSFLKHLLNNKLYAVVTVFGFAFSLTFVILLSVYIHKEYSINKSQVNKDRIYRATNEKYGNFPPAIGQDIQDLIPEIETFTRVYETDAIIHNKSSEKLKFNFILADSTFLNIFSFNLIEGDKKTALKTRNSIILTPEFAKKLFGNESPIGKQVFLNEDISCTVTGVMNDVAESSNFRSTDGVVNFRCLADLWHWEELLTSYGNCSFDLFLLAKPNTNLQSKVPLVLEYFKENFWIYKQERVKELFFEPLEESYFSTRFGRSITQGSKTMLIVLSAIVLLILVLAIINYMNLTIAQSSVRVKETAIKKLVGSSRKRLIRQYIFESILVCLFAFVISTLFCFLLEPIFERLLDTSIDLKGQLNIHVVLLVFAAVSLVGFVSGLFPAIVITKLNAIDVVKGSFRRNSKSTYSRLLIGFQYAVVITLLITTVFIAKQTKFMQNYNMGINTKNMLWFNNNVNYARVKGLKNQLMQIGGVKDVSFVEGSPLDQGNNWSFTYLEQPVSFQQFVVDSSFFSVFDININKSDAAFSTKGIWINKKGLSTLGLDFTATNVVINNNDFPILGIVEDFNFGSLHSQIEPLMIVQMDSNNYPWNFFIQLEGETSITLVEKIKTVYSDYTGGLPFDYGFMDAKINDWYNKEKRTAKIVGYFSLLTIIIASMGIFGMSIFYIQKRIKEIGVRKVNGAKVSEIMRLLSEDFIKWIFVSFVVACPVSYLILTKWLNNFAYKTELSWWVFILAGCSTLLMALLTVSYQTYRAARRNPVEALRYE